MSLPTLILASLILLVGLAILVFALSWFLSVLGGAQFVSTPHSVFTAIKSLAELNPGDQFIELGSGNGVLCFYIAKHTGARVHGIDINPLLILFARWHSRRNPDATFAWGNLYQTNLHRATVVYCYLLPQMLAKLSPKFDAELPKGARVISYAFPLPYRKPTHTIPRSAETGALYLYEF